MATTPYTKVSSASIAGLVTDGNALMNTEQSNLDESNYELLRDGTRRRRRPIVQEKDGSSIGSINTTQRSSYIWKTPSFRDNMSILCEEINEEIRFYIIDHNTPSYLRTNEIDEDRLALDLFGDGGHTSIDANISTPFVDSPCTYTEGNGALYIFNSRTGTIKVELLNTNRLRMTPIGVWVRDYNGSDQTEEIDYRRNSEVTDAVYATGIPYRDVNEKIRISASLSLEVAYNLSNTGWDAKAVSQFKEQSGKDYVVRDPSSAYSSTLATITEVNLGLAGVRSVINNPSVWPAVTDRYLAGRQVDERGTNQFSFPQLVQAKENKSMPPMGARIGTTDFGPAGTLVGEPANKTTSSVHTNVTTTFNTIEVTFDKRQSYVATASDILTKAFVHSLSFTVEKGGKTYQGGFSGIQDAEITDTDGYVLKFDYENLSLVSYTNFTLVEVYMHPSPEYFPHSLHSFASAFDYRTTARKPLTGAFFAGRLWQTSDTHNRLYYSQIVDTSTGGSQNTKLNKESLCFAAADPTDGDDNAVVPSDGGYINAADSGTHYGLVVLGDSLLLMTDRGVWAIRPGSNGVFTAANFKFVKVAGAQVLGTQAFTSTGDEVHVATDEGIISLVLESTSFGNTTVKVTRLLDKKLMQGYEGIIQKWPSPVGEYDSESRVVRWLFRAKTDNDYVDGEGQPILTLSMYHNAWYKYTLGSDSRVFDLLTVPYTAETTTYNKFRYLIGAPNFPTFFNTGWGVEVDPEVDLTFSYNPGRTGYWVDNGIDEDELFADYRPLTSDTTPRDPIPAYMLTNHMIPGEGIRWAQINYIVVHNRNVTASWIGLNGGMSKPSVDGGTLLSVRWDWMDQNSTGKLSTPYQTYKYRRSYLPTGSTEPNTYGEPVLVHKMKLRGRGREFRLYFESDGHKDSHIEGWAYQGYILNEV